MASPGCSGLGRARRECRSRPGGRTRSGWAGCATHAHRPTSAMLCRAVPSGLVVTRVSSTGSAVLSTGPCSRPTRMAILDPSGAQPTAAGEGHVAVSELVRGRGTPHDVGMIRVEGADEDDRGLTLPVGGHRLRHPRGRDRGCDDVKAVVEGREVDGGCRFREAVPGITGDLQAPSGCHEADRHGNHASLCGAPAADPTQGVDRLVGVEIGGVAHRRVAQDPSGTLGDGIQVHDRSSSSTPNLTARVLRARDRCTFTDPSLMPSVRAISLPPIS